MSGHTKSICFPLPLAWIQRTVLDFEESLVTNERQSRVIIATVPENIAMVIKPHVILNVLVLSHSKGSLLTDWVRTQNLLFRGFLHSCITDSSSCEINLKRTRGFVYHHVLVSGLDIVKVSLPG